MKTRHYIQYGLIFIIVYIYLWPSKYDQIMGPVLELKEKNPHLIIDGKPEPPFPSKKQNINSITGIDVNKNGIRDDLEIYANRVSKTELERKARYQLFEALEKLVQAVESQDIEKIRYADDFFGAAMFCFFDLPVKVGSGLDNLDNINFAYDESVELFDLLPRNSYARDLVPKIRKGEARNGYRTGENICSGAKKEQSHD